MDVTTSTTTPDVELQFSAIEELSEISMEILRQEDVRNEVFDVAMQPRYLDRFVALSDLLQPRSDDAETLVPARNPGAYRRAFDAIYDEATYPSLARYIRTAQLDNRGGPDQELYLYCPYCASYSQAQVTKGFTVAPNLVVMSSNAEPGSQLQADGSYRTVTVTDDYAATTPTLIVMGEPDGGLEAGPFEIITICSNGECCEYRVSEGPNGPVTTLQGCYPDVPPSPPTPPAPRGWEDCTGFDGVWTGRIEVTKQYDGVFGTNNGGSEMRLGRIGPENMIVQTNGHIQASGFSALAGYYVSREAIRSKRIYNWNVEFDPNWTCEEAPQRFIYYEDDRTASTTLSLSFTLSAKIKVGILEVGPGRTIGFSTTITSEDPVIWSQTYARDEFFSGNRRSRGCGVEFGWAKYSCNEGFLTLPEVYN